MIFDISGLNRTRDKIRNFVFLEVYSGWLNYYSGKLGLVTIGQDFFKEYVFFKKYKIRIITRKWRYNK